MQAAPACREASDARIDQSPHPSMCGRCRADTALGRRMGLSLRLPVSIAYAITLDKTDRVRFAIPGRTAPMASMMCLAASTGSSRTSRCP